jgi:hypothetical protein
LIHILLSSFEKFSKDCQNVIHRLSISREEIIAIFLIIGSKYNETNVSLYFSYSVLSYYIKSRSLFFFASYWEMDIRSLVFLLILDPMTILSPNIAEFLQRDPSNLPYNQPPFLEHLLAKIDAHIVKKGKILLLTLTKRSSEEITNFLVSK